MKKAFLLILFSTLSLIFMSLQGAVFNKSLAFVNTNTVKASDLIERKCSLNQLKNELPYQIKTIVIDAGHGGHDPGCSGPNSVEKHLALAIAKKFAAAVESKYPHINVILTRDKDVFIPLYERAAIANRARADLFVSIHCNALAGSKATWGSETYVMGLHTAEHNLDVAKRENDAILLEADYEQNYDYDPNSPEGHILLSMYQNAFLEQSIQFAERVEYHFHATAARKSRGVKQAGFVVLKETAMPSALVEAGFLTSAKDENFLKTEKGQNAAAEALLNAFRDYKILVEDTAEDTGFAYTKPVASPVPPTVQYNRAPPSNSVPTTTNYSDQASKGIVGAPYQNHQNNTATPTVPPAVKVQAERTIQAPNTPQYSTISTPVPAQERTINPSSRNTNTHVNFSIQLAAAPSPLNTRQGPWTSVDQLIEVIQENNLFKYQVRNITSLEEAFETRLQLQAKGFTDAFIVSYQDGTRITMEEARKLLEE